MKEDQHLFVGDIVSAHGVAVAIEAITSTASPLCGCQNMNGKESAKSKYGKFTFTAYHSWDLPAIKCGNHACNVAICGLEPQKDQVAQHPTRSSCTWSKA